MRSTRGETKDTREVERATRDATETGQTRSRASSARRTETGRAGKRAKNARQNETGRWGRTDGKCDRKELC